MRALIKNPFHLSVKYVKRKNFLTEYIQ